MVCQSVLNNLMYNSLSNEFLEKMDERRRLMIENELTQLVSKRDQVLNNILGSSVITIYQMFSFIFFSLSVRREWP